MPDASFGASAGDPSVKTKLINLMTSVRTLMRSMLYPLDVLPPWGDGDMRLMRVLVPLIGINTVIIAYEIALG